MPIRAAAALLLALTVPAFVALAAESSRPTPFRLQEALKLPDWLSVSVQSRYRYETLDGQFRAGGQGGDQALLMQTTALLEAGSKQARLGLEMIDARAVLDDSGTPLDTTTVGAADLLQAYGVFKFDNLANLNGANELRLGRQTIDFGSRRLLARNRFRNTINAFTGADWKFAANDGWSSEVFVAAPLVRLPGDKPSLLNDDAAWDEEDFGTVFWLIGVRSAPLLAKARLEAYVMGLHESDEVFATRNRNIVTPGFRFFREPAAAAFDYQLEVIMQAGTVRSDDKPSTVNDLDHFGHYENVQVGYTFKASWSPRVAAMFDYASGDGDPGDNRSGRFDSLFSARRFDYGPTSLWGAFSRANLVSPGARVTAQPLPEVQTMLAYRAFWLAEERDAWAAARVADSLGQSGDFIGNEFEFSVSWTVLPKNLALEFGGAFLLNGDFPDKAPSATGAGDSSYLYTQVSLAF